MHLSPDYHSHELTYQKLKQEGATGWGGERFEDRMQSWDRTIQHLQQSLIFPKAPAKILEIGSGAGDVSLKFARLGYQVSGIEISETAVAWAQAKAQETTAQFFQGSVCDLSRWSDETFEAVIDGNCFHCIIGEDRKRTLSEIHRVLQPQGFFFLSSMIGDPKEWKAHFKFDPITRCQIQNDHPYRYMGRLEDVLAELITFGFQIVETRIFNNYWWDHLECLVRKI